MALPERLVEKLACPICRRTLSYNRQEERLECQECRKVFRIDDDIPVLVADEAENLD